MTLKLRETGQTLAEYVLAAGLVALVGLGGMMLVADQISASLPGVLDCIFSGACNGSDSGGGSGAGAGAGPGATPGPGSLASVPGSTAPISPGTGSGIAGVIPPPGSHQEQTCFSSGLCVNIPSLEAGSVSETSGGLGGGTTIALSDTIHQLALQLEEAGGSPQTIEVLKQLADSGHEIGSLIEKQDIGPLACGGTPGSMCANGKTRAENFDSHINLQVAEQSTFEDLWNQAQQELGTKPDPLYRDILTVVNFEADQIKTIYDGQHNVITAGSFEPRNDAVIVHNSSNNICAQSGDTGCRKAK